MKILGVLLLIFCSQAHALNSSDPIKNIDGVLILPGQKIESKVEYIRPAWSIGASPNAPVIGFSLHDRYFLNPDNHYLPAESTFMPYISFSKIDPATKQSVADYEAFTIFMTLLEDTAEGESVQKIEITNSQNKMVVGYENACVLFSFLAGSPKKADGSDDFSKPLIYKPISLKATTLVSAMKNKVYLSEVASDCTFSKN